jgi:hypothetical protein
MASLEPTLAADLTTEVQVARTGLRSAVARLLERLDEGELCLPLREPITADAQESSVEELRLAPHMLVDPEDKLACALFTRAEFLKRAAATFNWSSGSEALEYCTLPARAALNMALGVIDGEDVVGVVLNACDETELFLQRHELASLLAGQPIPLVGYVRRVAPDVAADTLLAEPGDQPPAELSAALAAALAKLPAVSGHQLLRTFNAERDLEPHYTLILHSAAEPAEQERLAAELVALIAEKLPPPGYIDVFFDTRPKP